MAATLNSLVWLSFAPFVSSVREGDGPAEQDQQKWRQTEAFLSGSRNPGKWTIYFPPLPIRLRSSVQSLPSLNGSPTFFVLYARDWTSRASSRTWSRSRSASDAASWSAATTSPSASRDAWARRVTASSPTYDTVSVFKLPFIKITVIDQFKQVAMVTRVTNTLNSLNLTLSSFTFPGLVVMWLGQEVGHILSWNRPKRNTLKGKFVCVTQIFDQNRRVMLKTTF